MSYIESARLPWEVDILAVLVLLFHEHRISFQVIFVFNFFNQCLNSFSILRSFPPCLNLFSEGLTWPSSDSRLQSPTAGGVGSVPGWETKVLHVLAAECA